MNGRRDLVHAPKQALNDDRVTLDHLIGVVGEILDRSRCQPFHVFEDGFEHGKDRAHRIHDGPHLGRLRDHLDLVALLERGDLDFLAVLHDKGRAWIDIEVVLAEERRRPLPDHRVRVEVNPGIDAQVDLRLARFLVEDAILDLAYAQASGKHARLIVDAEGIGEQGVDAIAFSTAALGGVLKQQVARHQDDEGQRSDGDCGQASSHEAPPPNCTAPEVSTNSLKTGFGAARISARAPLATMTPS